MRKCTSSSGITIESMKYLHNLLEMPILPVILLIGIVLVLFGLFKSSRSVEYRKGIWFTGIGTVLTVLVLLLIAGWNNTAYYPSNIDLQSSLTLANSCSSEGNHAVLRLPSGETRMVLVSCRATVGVVSNGDHNLESAGKAGRSRWLGRRPHNRGVVMNPVDHPMGGGEGRQSGGHPRSRKGLYAKGLKTRRPKKQSSKYIIERRKK